MKSVSNKVSVVIPAYNAERYIAEAIESVLSQFCPAHQLIIVNDGSTDDTGRIARSYGDSLIVIDKENGGVSAARNHGAQLVTGDWVIFLDADDFMVSTAICDLLGLSNDRRYGVVYGGIVEFDTKSGKRTPRGGGNAEGLPPFPAKANFPRALIVTPGAAMVRMDLHNKIGGFHKPWQPAEDRDYWIKLGVNTGFRFINKVVLEKRFHKSQSTKKYMETLIYWGMVVQLDYLKWLDEQGIDKDFLHTDPRKIALHTIRKTLRTRRWNSLKLILETLSERGISSPVISLTRLIDKIRRFAVFHFSVLSSRNTNTGEIK